MLPQSQTGEVRMSKVQDVVRDRQLFYVEEGKSVADVARRMLFTNSRSRLVPVQGNP